VETSFFSLSFLAGELTQKIFRILSYIMACIKDPPKKDKTMAVTTTIVQPSTRVFVTPLPTTGGVEKLTSASNHQGSTNRPGKANTHRTSSSVVAKHVHRAPVLQHKDEGLSVSTLRKIKRRLFLEAVNSDTHHHHQQQLRTESSPRKQRTNNSVHTGSGKENDMECG
jgi:hypothetical protein